MSDFNRYSIVWSEWCLEGLPAPVVDIVGDTYTFGQMTVECEDGSIWHNKDVWHSRDLVQVAAHHE